MTMVDFIREGYLCVQTEISVSAEWIFGILIGAITTSALWYILLIGSKYGENKLTK
ncbi:MAG: hypothetical protein HQ522_19890 [Bacteroidetes bacterium]|nr:hypothetical protein [Bacteroidota bacterium]